MSALRFAAPVVALSLALAGAPVGAPGAAAAPAAAAPAAAPAAVTLMRFEVVIRTEGLSAYTIARDEVTVGRRARDLGLTVVDWHTGRGIVVAAPTAADAAPLVDDRHVVSLVKLA
ncbi:hypothetical protein [Arsenicicoccus dermatophilus]|uniref:hypothetical protein n=1 Tax=Arsenicicoccus dermatophilus TaxID=1076331 RepID=UPI0039174DC1